MFSNSRRLIANEPAVLSHIQNSEVLIKLKKVNIWHNIASASIIAYKVYYLNCLNVPYCMHLITFSTK